MILSDLHPLPIPPLPIDGTPLYIQPGGCLAYSLFSPVRCLQLLVFHPFTI